MPAAGERLGPFFLRKILGEGGQSVVWLADDLRRGDQVALKVLRTGVVGASFRARMKRESELLAAISDPGLPRGIEFYEDATTGTVALSMEYVRGSTLERLVGPAHPLAVLTLGRAILRVLAKVHAHGVVHRDIKPANILLRPGWEAGDPSGVVLVDFGIALGTDTNSTRYTAPGGVAGTVAFIAPELLFAHGVEVVLPRVDIFSTGVVLWSLLTGSHPTGLPMTAPIAQLAVAYHAGGAPVVGLQLRGRIEQQTPGLISCLEKFVSRDPGQRYQGADLAAAALEVVATGSAAAEIHCQPAANATPAPATPAAPSAKAGNFTNLPSALEAPYVAPQRRKPAATPVEIAPSMPASALSPPVDARAHYTALPERLQAPYAPAAGGDSSSRPRSTSSDDALRATPASKRRWVVPVAAAVAAVSVAVAILVWASWASTPEDSKGSTSLKSKSNETDQDPEKSKSTAVKAKKIPDAEEQDPPRQRTKPPDKLLDSGRWVTIEGGTFVPGCFRDCDKHRSVTVSSFRMNDHEVTQDEFDEYVKDGGTEPSGKCWIREGSSSGGLADWKFPHEGGRHPVVCVNVNDTRNYASWRSRKTGVTMRLPTDIEWEWAARGGTSANAFAWGRSWPPPEQSGNIADTNASSLVFKAGEAKPIYTVNDGFKFSAPVGSYYFTGGGLYDMGGNVYEWTSSCSIRGSSWDSGNDRSLHLTSASRGRVPCESRFTATGFRLVRDD